MSTAVAQGFDTQVRYYPQTRRQTAEKPMPKYREISVDREATLQSIAFLTQYMEDLKAGRPVENIHPDNDPWFLVPENIAIMIESDKSLLNGKVIGQVIRRVSDLWE
ncbi:MAG: hypothetical protein FWH36_09545 [Lentimicrobiaceae bacterium]|nr:hypothetical protein [Lentimicrobiaceae bacterium]